MPPELSATGQLSKEMACRPQEQTGNPGLTREPNISDIAKTQRHLRAQLTKRRQRHASSRCLIGKLEINRKAHAARESDAPLKFARQMEAPGGRYTRASFWAMSLSDCLSSFGNLHPWNGLLGFVRPTGVLPRFATWGGAYCKRAGCSQTASAHRAAGHGATHWGGAAESWPRPGLAGDPRKKCKD